jgi:hypothetical protein
MPTRVCLYHFYSQIFSKGISFVANFFQLFDWLCNNENSPGVGLITLLIFVFSLVIADRYLTDSCIKKLLPTDVGEQRGKETAVEENDPVTGIRNEASHLTNNETHLIYQGTHQRNAAGGKPYGDGHGIIFSYGNTSELNKPE